MSNDAVIVEKKEAESKKADSRLLFCFQRYRLGLFMLTSVWAFFPWIFS